MADIDYSTTLEIFKRSNSIRDFGRRLGAKSEAAQYRLGKKIMAKFNFDRKQLQWNATISLSDKISKQEAVKLANQYDTLQELGEEIYKITGYDSNRFFLAHKLLDTYGLDDKKFSQRKTDDLTREEVLQIYETSTSKKDFMTKLGYRTTSSYQNVLKRFNLEEKEFPKTSEKKYETSQYWEQQQGKEFPLSTYARGEITELQVAIAFIERNITISKPLVASSRYDYVVDIGGNFYKIQVKTAKEITPTSFEFSTSSTWKN